MGTWIVHLRVADHFIDRINGLDVSEFVAGSVSPDCGYKEQTNSSGFIPPPQTTHWTPTGKKADCRYKDFYKTYLTHCRSIKDFSFYLGYYMHLVTDIIWSVGIFEPTKLKFKEEYIHDPKFISKIKQDWNDLDFKYLKEHPHFRALEILDSKKEIAQYLPYYEPNQLTVQCREIVDFYKDNAAAANTDRKFIYLSGQEQDDFIKEITYIIEYDLTEKGILDPTNRQIAV